MRTLLVFNDASGKGRAPQIARRVQARLTQDQVTQLGLQLCDHRVLEEVVAVADRVIAIGGDGTFRSVALAARQARIPIGLIPAGTGNAVASALGLNLTRTVSLLEQSATCPLDLLETNLGPAVFVAGAGFDAAVVGRVSRRSLARWGRMAYLPAVRACRRAYRESDVRVVVEGRLVFEGACWMCCCSNLATLGGNITISQAARPDDGLVHVSLFTPPMPSFVRMVALLGQAAYLRMPVPSDGSWSGRSVRISMSQELPVELGR